MNDTALRDQITRLAESMFKRGLSSGSSGNISVRTDDGGWLMTPTGSSLGDLDPARISKLDSKGHCIDGDQPTKESFLHQVMYAERESTQAVVHLHSTHSVAVSCLADIDPQDVLPALTAYYVMRVHSLPLVPYFAPGDKALAEAVRSLASKHHAVLLANHGPVVAGNSLLDAVYAIEELEETAKLFLMLRGQAIRPLNASQIADLRARFS